MFILANRKWRTFYLKDDNGKLWVETIIVTFLDVVATVDVLTASYNDVLKTCRNSKRIFCMTIKSSSRLERINKLEGDNSYWQILSLVCPLKYHVFRGISRSKKKYIYITWHCFPPIIPKALACFRWAPPFLSYGSHSGREGADESLFCNLACFVLVCVVLIYLPFNNNLRRSKDLFIRVLTQKAQKWGKPGGRGGGQGWPRKSLPA